LIYIFYLNRKRKREKEKEREREKEKEREGGSERAFLDFFFSREGKMHYARPISRPMGECGTPLQRIAGIPTKNPSLSWI